GVPGEGTVRIIPRATAPLVSFLLSLGLQRSDYHRLLLLPPPRDGGGAEYDPAGGAARADGVFTALTRDPPVHPARGDDADVSIWQAVFSPRRDSAHADDLRRRVGGVGETS